MPKRSIYLALILMLGGCGGNDSTTAEPVIEPLSDLKNPESPSISRPPDPSKELSGELRPPQG
ncbi:MAG: hypothetical protein IPM37_03335 [Hahellaceae bacterium]|jgi:hypothetical protein|nr:hypothetical protein [Hahellaceae bacterium]